VLKRVSSAPLEPGKKKTHEIGAGESAANTLPKVPVELDPERARSQEIYNQVTDQMKREPTQSSRLLQSWIHSD
jgi:hypothetical protein